MDVAVLGAGGGGLAVAYEWASQGHRVSLYAQRIHDDHLAPVRERGGIQAEGLLEGFAPLETVTSDIAEALEGVEVVFVVGPAYATEPFGADTRGHLHPGMTVVVPPELVRRQPRFQARRGAGPLRREHRRRRDQHAAVRLAGDCWPAPTCRIFHRVTPVSRLRRPALQHAPAPGDPPPGVPQHRGSRGDLPDHAAERQPGHPPCRHPAQRRAHRAHRGATSCSTRRGSPRRSAAS